MVSLALRRGLMGLAVSVLAVDVLVLSVFPWWYGTPTTVENFMWLLAILPTAWYLRAAPELQAPAWLSTLLKAGVGIVVVSAVLMALAMAAGLHWSAMPFFYLGFMGVLVIGIGFLGAILLEMLPAIARAVDRPGTLGTFKRAVKLFATGLVILMLLALWGGVLGLTFGRNSQVLAVVAYALALGGIAVLTWGVLDLVYHGLRVSGEPPASDAGATADA